MNLLNNVAKLAVMLFVGYLATIAASATYVRAQSFQNILVLVNDEPISAFDLRQRISLIVATSGQARKLLKRKVQAKSTQKLFQKMVQKARPSSQGDVEVIKKKLFQRLQSDVNRELRPKVKKQALEELISERLQIQAASKLGVLTDDKELDNQLATIARRNKDPKTGKQMDLKRFIQGMRRSGIDVREYKRRLKAQLSWIKVIRRKYGQTVHVGAQQVDKLLAGQNPTGDTQKATFFQLQRIRLSYPANADQSLKARRLIEAAKLQGAFRNCKNSSALVNKVSGASVKSLGRQAASKFPSPLRDMLLLAKDGQMTPPSFTSSGIEMYAVCSRSETVPADKKKRLAVQSKLRQEELQLLAQRHLKDLRQDAFIEYKNKS